MNKLTKIILLVGIVLLFIIFEPISNIIYSRYSNYLEDKEADRIEREVAELCPRYSDYILNLGNLSESEQKPLQLYYLTIERTTPCCFPENYKLCLDYLNISYKSFASNKTQILIRISDTDWRLIDFGIPKEKEPFVYLKYSYYQVNDSFWDYKRI